MNVRLQVKYLLILPDKLEFSQQIFEKLSSINFQKKICSVGVVLFHVDGRTDGHNYMKKTTAAFRKFAKAHKQSIQIK
jgi:collagenase-like PrtC family protease